MYFFLVFIFLHQIQACQIFFSGMHASQSHIGSMLPLATSLLHNGHDITFLETSAFNESFKFPPDIHNYFISLPEDNLDFQLAPMWHQDPKPIHMQMLFGNGDHALINVMDRHRDTMNPILNATWDMVFADELFGMSAIGIAIRNTKLHGKPYIIYSTTVLMHLFSWMSSLSRMPYARPSMWTPNDDNLDHDITKLQDRILTTAHAFYAGITTKYMVENQYNGGVARLGIEKFSFWNLWNEAAMNFLEEVDQFSYPMPVSTDVINIGQHCSPSKGLPQSLEQFVDDSSSKGTIYIAFGTNVLWKYAPERIMTAFVDTLNELKDYRIIFVFNGIVMPKVQAHVKLLQWAPQVDILEHTKTVLFISHGGLKSVKEAICSATPVIYMPLFAEQTHNVILVKRMGFAETLNKYTVTASTMLAIVQHILSTPRYKENAVKFRSIFLDRPIPSLDEGVFWVNRVIKRGKPTFKRKGARLWFYETFYLIESMMVTFLCILIGRK